MNRFYVVCSIVIAFSCVQAAEPIAEPTKTPPRDPKNTDRPGWKLVWSDEFEIDGAPDPKKWGYEKGFVRNNEMQYYTEGRSENARVENGNLVIEARKEKFPNPGYNANKKGSREFFEYTSASLTTEKNAAWTYARVEVRAKVPTGRGTWPAIWMLGKNIHEVGWPKCGEIDIMENVGFDADGIHTTVHTQTFNHLKGNGKGHRETVAKPYEDFHVYAMEWNETAIKFLINEKEVFKFENNGKGVDCWPFDKPQVLLISLAMGGAWGGAKGVDASIWPQKYYVDYVRVYERADSAQK